MPAPSLIDALALLAVLLMPGTAVLGLAGWRYAGLERVAAALGLSLALTPLALLWTTLAGLSWSAGAVRLTFAGGACALVAGLTWRALVAGAHRFRRPRRYRAPESVEPSPDTTSPPEAADRRAPRGWLGLGLGLPELTALACCGLALALRWHDGQAIAVPAWVDGLHHTIIAQAIAEAGSVPSDLRPWVALDRFYYHFGFHATAATFVWVAGASAPDAVLVVGQSLAALVAIPTWWLALRLTGSRWAATAAALVPATLYWFPAYFVAWSRYTQLAGLVVLPVAWVLLWDALVSARAGRRTDVAAAIGLAAAAAGGLVLVHYRVAVFYAIGACVALAGAAAWPAGGGRPAWDAPHVRRVFARFASVALVGGALVAPWLGRRILGGVQAMSAIRADWFAWEQASNAVPAWLLTVGDNQIWLAVGAIGVLAGALGGRRGAVGVIATLAVCALATQPARIGLPASWMLPTFSIAISLFLPVALGLAFLVSTASGLPTARAWAGRGDWPLAATLLGVAIVGAARMHLEVAGDDGNDALTRVRAGTWRVRTMDNPSETEIFTFADQAGMEWVRANTPRDARFLVSTGHWQLGAFRGLDGGYWLPLLADRQASAPAALYTFGAEADVLATQAICERAARGDALSDDDVSALMVDGSFDHLYIGPAAARHGGFSAERIRRHPDLEAVFERDGVHVFRFRP